MAFLSGNGRAASCPPLPSILLFLSLLLSFVITTVAQQCSATNHCETGCCSQWGFCGFGDEFCGAGCLSTCDYEEPSVECSETKHCATGCCSQWGFCGFGEDFCGSGCRSTCDAKLGCDANNPCADGTCCSKFGFCGLGPDFCSTENCVAGCDAKAFCDPGGYGPEHAQLATCPLNVCCSKWGWCGMTAEFCGEKKVKRPSCPADDKKPMKRVVGYFEGWAPTRKCQSFGPEDIPAGVYTHINYAFASIDPVSYRIIPANTGDVSLYDQVTGLKYRDKNLKVFIAIGGWSFNDPGPTREIFSKLAADPDKQRVFFSSLVSFMTTYNFDGVDIDWEYPGAPDRGGRAGDFENMPAFIANLRKALQSSGTGRTGLSMALPVAYWYLQHFDIKKVAPHVDFFNMMSYDLHGSWDRTNKWVGPYLNSHTNLTEITEYLDLLWRNDIESAKVNMGLGFYTRHFTAASEACMEPGCVYESAGPKGPCTNALGVLSIAEIMDLEAQPGPPAALDPDAAVNILKRGRQWITYDDELTWDLKVKRARELCLGGVMVWAISQDTKTGRFSRELQAATGYRSPGTAEYDLGNGDLLQASVGETLIDQCRWSGCGKECPNGYVAVSRYEGWLATGAMRVPTGCTGGQTSVFCCPADKNKPWCIWSDFNNGRCGKKDQSKCPSGWSEIGSHTVACRSNSLWQVGCCITAGPSAVPSTKNYAACSWQGTPPQCGFDKHQQGTSIACKDAGGRQYLVDSYGGSGGAVCQREDGFEYPRAYCCDVDAQGHADWGDCEWTGGSRDDSGHCASDCPDNAVRVAFEWAPQCLSGGRSSCCTGTSKVNQRRSLEERWRAGLKAAIDGQCHNVFSMFRKRDVAPDRFEVVAQLRGRQTSLAACEDAVQLGIEAIEYENNEAVYIWDSVLGKFIGDLRVKKLRKVAKTLKKTNTMATEKMVRTIIDGPAMSGAMLVYFPPSSRGCGYDWFGGDFGEEYRVDPDIEAAEGDPNEDLGWIPEDSLLPGGSPFGGLVKRSGSRDFKVHDRVGTGASFSVTSSSYPSGDSGDNLIAASGGLIRRYVIESSPTGQCGPQDFQLTKQGNRNSYKWVSEHIIELQTIPRFIEFMNQRKIPDITRDHFRQTQLFLPSSDVTPNWSDLRGHINDPSGPLGPYGRVMLSQLGSDAYASNMVVCEEVLNGIKARLWSLKNPMSMTKWVAQCGAGVEISGLRALSFLQHVLGVFDYLGDPIVKARHKSAYEAVRGTLGAYESHMRSVSPGHAVDYRALWREYNIQHMMLMSQFAKYWVLGKLRLLEATWSAAYLVAFDTYTTNWIVGMIQLIDEYTEEIDTQTGVDTSIFT